MLEPYLATVPALAIPAVPVPTTPTLPGLSTSARMAAQQAREARVRTLGEASWKVESVTGTARYAPQIRAYADHWSAQLGTTTRAGLHFIRSGETRWL
jgi:hypothetical protein